MLFEDLYDMMDRDKCAPSVDTVEREWHKQTEGLDYQRYIAVARLVRFAVCITGYVILIQEGLLTY